MSLIPHLKALIAEKHLLNHPFYQMWTAGTLPLEVMQRYAEQYYHLERNFPRFLSQIHANCESPEIRQAITDNLYDEEHGNENHRELWLRFAEAIGVNREQVVNSTMLPETQEAVETFTKMSKQSTIAGVAALSAYESQIPEVAGQKIDGLQKHYNVTDENGTAFFRVHSTVDVIHADAWWNILEDKAKSSDEQQEAEAGVIAGRDALWNFLSGICREYLSPTQLATCKM